MNSQRFNSSFVVSGSLGLTAASIGHSSDDLAGHGKARRGGGPSDEPAIAIVPSPAPSTAQKASAMAVVFGALVLTGLFLSMIAESARSESAANAVPSATHIATK